ncbi:unnamed protein product [Phyllotreta striolata]|uniref:MIF4G domain-containing protein n=1 Tax=Phyllotreta striolata TaxID=444603 RepID=A0A9N9XIY1_PHYSR|nr:unnamed protein product [Phyllotreta striolata]
MENTTLWNKDSKDLQTKRRPPKTIPYSELPASQQNSQPNSVQFGQNAEVSGQLQQRSDKKLEQLVANSTLRADAEEWFPSKPIAQPVPLNNPGENPSRIQDRLKKHKNPEKVSENDGVNDDNQAHMVENRRDSSADFDRLKRIIGTLTKDPGQFHNLLDIFMETLEPYVSNGIPISDITGIIVNQAIIYPNFRYTGARLCWYIERISPMFRANLHMICKKKIVDNQDNSDIMNCLPFIAELYIHLPHENLYGSLLITAFQKLINIGDSDSIKCVCQSLKLTGYSLERSNKSDLDKVVDDLKSFIGRVEGSARILLDSVFQLRSSNWGHTGESTESESDDHDTFDEEVFYEGLTNEESEFIARHMTAQDDFDSEDFDPDELCDPEPEMDEEIQEAFKEFVRLSGKR